jgi:hypothetical protein
MTTTAVAAPEESKSRDTEWRALVVSSYEVLLPLDKRRAGSRQRAP